MSLITVGLSSMWVNYHLVRSDLKQQVRERAQSITQGLEFATEGSLELGHASNLRRVVQNYATLPAVVQIAIVSPDGRILAHSSSDGGAMPSGEGISIPLKQAMELAASTGRSQTLYETIGDRKVLVDILPFSSYIFETQGKRGLAIAILDLQQIEQDSWHTFFTSTVTMTVGTIGILVLMGLALHKTILGPLKRLNCALERSQKTETFNLPSAMPDNEIGFLAKTFEKVFQKLEKHEQLQKEIEERKLAVAALRESETRERAKSEQLACTLEDLTQAQSQLIQTEKMSSLGQMVAGVAHEINNPVNFIHGNLSHAKDYIRDLLNLVKLYQREYPQPTAAIEEEMEAVELDFLSEDLGKLLGSMKVGTDRIRDIVCSLRMFSRLDEAEIKQADLHDGIDSTLMILHHRLKPKPEYPGIQIIKAYDRLPEIGCYAGQLNQVFMNILSNAIDALDEYNRSRTAKEIQLSPSTIWIRTAIIDRDWVEIRISDNGPGMSEEVRSKLFDPFFTTKAVGQGTGLGLSISYQIVVDKHGGSLQCYSGVGLGAEFAIRIPTRQTLERAA
ncbi:sensor histidine kinase [Oscillatoriales cyanobacterium LEGE 11467]|uniref:histidine kinase n=2 Tax=Zarconia TaxID=2992130 RepID=A0A928VYH8_9CYAN|nr:sensor histidine kinase [Zarconia navalis LEGE 11467]